MISKKDRPKIEVVNLDWVNKMQEKYSVSDYELSLQMGREREYIGGIRTGRKFSIIAKAALWHIFKRCENKTKL